MSEFLSITFQVFGLILMFALIGMVMSVFYRIPVVFEKLISKLSKNNKKR